MIFDLSISFQIDALEKAKPGSVEILLETRVKGLVSWNEYITGVRIRGADGKTS